ncbi:hypothetical protein C2G38_2153313 [Gigaspora rosea]|uniref:Uncharacterized protein n=1 Tax=Gigaspora rosea TaxID=44941 RepID=A0A397W681_9GLOM|nr:hypothetical protein C2G38_2153313 [Gigaspora rosea]
MAYYVISYVMAPSFYEMIYAKDGIYWLFHEEHKRSKRIVQNSDLPSNPEDWFDKTFIALKNILKNCLSYICYSQISCKDVADYILLYSQIFEKKLCSNLVKSFLLSDYNVTLTLPSHIILKPELPTRSIEMFSKVISELKLH